MKFRFLCLLLQLLTSCIVTSNDAIAATAFLESYAEAVVAAKESGKPIFLDAYTTWCAPCKKMELEVFSKPQVANYLKTNFIALRLNMEEAEGLELAARYRISQYPTLLVLDSTGEIHRGVGFFDVDNLLAFAKTSLDNKQNYRALKSRYQSGDRSLPLLKTLTQYAKTAGISEYTAYAYQQLIHEKSWHNPLGQELLLAAVNDIDHPLFDSLVAHRVSLANAFSAPVVDERIARLLDTELFGETPAKKKQAKKLIRRAYPSSSDSTYIRYQMRKAREAGKAKRYGRYAIKWQQDYPTSDPDELEELIYVFESRLPGWKEEEVESWKIQQETLREAQGVW